MSWRCFPRAFFHHHPHQFWHGRPGGHCGGPSPEMNEDCFGGSAFGVRRPLRFLAHKLDLDERQTAELARILDALKIERAQGEVDQRRTVASFADALAGDAFDTAKAGAGGDLRVRSAERLREAVLNALQQIHGVLTPEQRTRLATLIRTGVLTL